MNRDIKEVSTYHLLIMLFYDGSAEILPEISPLDIQLIISELAARHNVNFKDDKNLWANWAINHLKSPLRKEEITSIEFIYKVISTEKKYLDRLKKEEG